MMLDKNIDDAVKSRITFINNISYQLMTLVVIVLSFIPLGFFIWANKKGFEITDEGFYLTASQYPSEFKFFFTMAHIYTAWMFNWVGQNIINLRAFGEILLFGSASIFFWGWYRLVILFYPQIKNSVHTKMMAWSATNLGALLFYVYFFFTPQYNLLNAVSVNAATGFFCLSLVNLSLIPIKRNHAFIHLFVAGLFIGAGLVIKFPTAITITFLYTFVLLLWPTLNKKVRWSSITMLGLGIVVWILFHVFYFQPWQLLWHGIYDGIAAGIYNASHHGLIYNLRRYPLEFFHLIFTVFQNFWVIYFILTLAFLIAYKAYKGVHARKWFSKFYIFLFFLIGCYCFNFKFYKGGLINHLNLTQFYLAWLLLLTMSVFFNIIYQKELIEKWKNITGKRMLLLCMLFFALPFAAVLGTANFIAINLIINMTQWIGLIQILLLSLSFSNHSRWIYFTGTFIISAFASTQIISAGFLAPYKLYTTASYQNVPTPIGVPPTYLEIDKVSSDFFNQMSHIAFSHGFKAGDDILAFSNMPGIVFALGGKSPVISWYMAYPHAKEVNEWFLNHTTRERIKRAFILQNESGKEGFPDLAKYGIQFPDDYILCGQLTWPVTGDWVKLWKPKILN